MPIALANNKKNLQKNSKITNSVVAGIFKIIKSYFITFSLLLNNFTNILLSYMAGPISTTIDYLLDPSQTQQVRR
jgi:hypothetical protein